MRILSVIALVTLLIAFMFWYNFREVPQVQLTPVSPTFATESSSSHPQKTYSPPVLSSTLLTKFANRNLSMHERFSGDVLSAIPRVSSPSDAAGLASVLIDTLDQDSVRNEAANILSRSKSPELLPALLKVLENPEEKARFRAFAAQHLGGFLKASNLDAREVATQKLRELMVDEQVEVRREAVFALVKNKDPQAENLATQWLNDATAEAEETRDVSIRCIAEMNRREALPRIRELAVTSNEPGRIAAINTLVLWKDDSSRPVFEAASKDQSERIRRAGKAAVHQMDSLDRLIAPESQTVLSLAQALQHERLQIRNEAAIALLRHKKDALPALPALAESLSRLEPICTTAQIVAYLDVLRNLGETAKSATPALSELLNERARIYLNRKKPEVNRLRSYVLLTLSEIGESEGSVQYIVDSLANSDSEMVFNYAASAKAAGKYGANAGALVPLLLRSLREEFVDSAITLESYHAPITPSNKTCAKLESIRALARIGSAAGDAIPLLEKITNSEFKQTENLPDCRAEARNALAAIRGITKL